MNRRTILIVVLLICASRMEAEQIQCQLGQRNDLQFIQYNSAAVTTTGSVEVTCTSGAAYSIEFNSGTTTGATTANRMMYCNNCAPSTLGYQLFSDASYTTNWGNAIGSDTMNGTGTGNSQTFTIYGRIPALEAFYAGQFGSNYNDYITVTIYCSSCAFISGNDQRFTVHLQQTNKGCGITAHDLNFGNYTGAEAHAATTLEVGCSSGTTYNVSLNAGTSASGSKRGMTGPNSAVLYYNLYSTAGYTIPWGDQTSNWVSGEGNGKIQNLTVYGVISAGQSVSPGIYTDTVTATITY